MLGVKYYRIINDFLSAEVADFLGISASCMTVVENDRSFNHSAELYMKLCEIYGVTIDDLMAEWPEVQKKYVYKATNAEKNVIGNYRAKNLYTMRTLAQLLGVSRQTVCNICNMAEPPAKYIEQLAKIEGISMAAFKKKYGKVA